GQPALANRARFPKNIRARSLGVLSHIVTTVGGRDRRVLLDAAPTSCREGLRPGRSCADRSPSPAPPGKHTTARATYGPGPGPPRTFFSRAPPSARPSASSHGSDE